MAFVKVKVDALEQQKKEYEKAIKSLDGALEQIKKVNASLGTDAMLEGVRTSLTKLAVSLETRQGTLLVMIKALEQSGTKYRTAQKKAVTRSNQFRAHHRDFYGNPVVVTVVAGGAGAMAGAAADAGVRPAVYTERGTSTTVSQVSERARNTAQVCLLPIGQRQQPDRLLQLPQKVLGLQTSLFPRSQFQMHWEQKMVRIQILAHI